MSDDTRAYEAMRYQNQGLVFQGPRPTPSVDGAIATIRERAAHLRKQIASVPEWERELLRIEATLKAWGDK